MYDDVSITANMKVFILFHLYQCVCRDSHAHVLRLCVP